MKIPTTRIFAALVAAALALPLVTASHDGDPVHDGAEALVCSFGDVRSTLAMMPDLAGRCVSSSNYASPLFLGTPCSECSSRTTTYASDEPLTGAINVPAVPLPPEDVPAIGPVPTPPVDQPVGTLQAQRLGTTQRYCITFTPQGESPLTQCLDVGPAAAFLPSVPPTELVQVDPQTVGPTPGVEGGSLGSTPSERIGATSYDLSLTRSWSEGRLNQRLGPGLVNVWEPVDFDDPAAVDWWVQNGEGTAITLTFNIRVDGETYHPLQVHVPYAGQALAALIKQL